MPSTQPGRGLYAPMRYATIIAGAASGRRMQNRDSRTGRGAASARRHRVEPLQATTPGVMPLPSVTTVISSILLDEPGSIDRRESGPARAFGWPRPARPEVPLPGERRFGCPPDGLKAISRGVSVRPRFSFQELNPDDLPQLPSVARSRVGVAGVLVRYPLPGQDPGKLRQSAYPRGSRTLARAGGAHPCRRPVGARVRGRHGRDFRGALADPVLHVPLRRLVLQARDRQHRALPKLSPSGSREASDSLDLKLRAAAAHEVERAGHEYCENDENHVEHRVPFGG